MSSNNNPYWLNDDFDVTKATKWQLRSWISMYNYPVPTSNVNVAELRALFKSNVYKNRQSLRQNYHSKLDLNNLSPIPALTPSRVSAVLVSDKQLLDYGMVKSHIQESPTPHIVHGKPNPEVNKTDQNDPQVVPIFNRGIHHEMTKSSTNITPTKSKQVKRPTSSKTRSNTTTKNESSTDMPLKWTPEMGALHASSSLHSNRQTSALSKRNQPSLIRRQNAIPPIHSLPTLQLPLSPDNTLPNQVDSVVQFAQFDISKNNRKYTPSVFDHICTRIWSLMIVFFTTITMTWTFLHLSGGYCSTLDPQPTVPDSWRYALGLGCSPCPIHSICHNGLVTQCIVPEYVAKSLTWSFVPKSWQVWACVPDDQLQVNVDYVVDQIVSKLRNIAGQNECVTNPTNPFAQRSVIRTQWVPEILESVQPKSMHSIYTQRVISILFHEDDMQLNGYKVIYKDQETDDPSIMATQPILPFICRSQKWIISQKSSLIGASILIMILFVTYLFHKRKLKLERISRSIAEEITKLLQDQDRQVEASLVKKRVLGIMALQTKYLLNYVPSELRRQDFDKVWEMVTVTVDMDPNIRCVVTKHRDQIIEGWEWCGFNSLLVNHSQENVKSKQDDRETN